MRREGRGGGGARKETRENREREERERDREVLRGRGARADVLMKNLQGIIRGPSFPLAWRPLGLLPRPQGEGGKSPLTLLRSGSGRVLPPRLVHLANPPETGLQMQFRQN